MFRQPLVPRGPSLAPGGPPRARRQIAEKTSSFDEVFLSMEYEKAGLLFYQMDSDAWK